MLLLHSFCQLALLKAAGTPTSTSVFWQLDEVDATMLCVCVSVCLCHGTMSLAPRGVPRGATAPRTRDPGRRDSFCVPHLLERRPYELAIASATEICQKSGLFPLRRAAKLVCKEGWASRVGGCPLPWPQRRDRGAALQKLLQRTVRACNRWVTRTALQLCCVITEPPLILALECNKLALSHLLFIILY